LNRAREIQGKYIRPPRTMDFAFMFVPAESVFYLVLKNRRLHEELLRMRVVPTSPNSLYAYLQALAYAYRGLKIQEKTQELQKAIAVIARDFEHFAADYRKVGQHLSHAASKFQETQKDVDRFTETIDRLKSAQIVPLLDQTQPPAAVGSSIDEKLLEG
jgi:DNA recombination protein RmuC